MRSHAAALLILGCAACGSRNIDLTRGPAPSPSSSSSSSNGTAAIGEPCTAVSDCQSSLFCQKKACGESIAGACAPLPKECKATVELVCGCDGITYTNDCVRTAYGIAGSTIGPCTVEEW